MNVLSFGPTGPGGVQIDPAPRRDRRRTKQQAKTLTYLSQVECSLANLRGFWPVTLRQLYYNLVGKGVIANNRNSYQKLSRTLGTARIQEQVPWDAIEDRVRETITSWGWEGPGKFVEDQLDDFLFGYHRDLLQSQTVNIEILIEKDALSRIASDVARDYGIPVLVCRGNNSISKSKEFCDRARLAAAGGRPTRILYFGDLDPSGVAMLPSVLHTMRVEMGLGENVAGYFCALQPWHVTEYGLPRDPDAIKRGDSRARSYMQTYGNLSVELDALPPRTLQRLIRESIEAHLDVDAYRRELAIESEDRLRIAKFRDRVGDLLDSEPWEGWQG